MEEIWKDVYHNGRYVGKKISNFGRMIFDDGRIAKVADNGAGYLTYPVTWYRDEGGVIKSVRMYVHRLVAEYFIDNPDNLPQVNHKDCDKSNNHVGNLEWVSRKSNIDHVHASGRMKKRYEIGAVKILTLEEVKEAYTRVKCGEGVNVVAQSMGKPRTTISSIINKRSRRDITDEIDKQLDSLQNLDYNA